MIPSILPKRAYGRTYFKAAAVNRATVDFVRVGVANPPMHAVTVIAFVAISAIRIVLHERSR